MLSIESMSSSITTYLINKCGIYSALINFHIPILWICIILMGACQMNSSPQVEGKSLAHSYCASCHSYPDPSLLDKTTWETYVLPRMGNMMGFYPNDSSREELLGEGKGRDHVIRSGLYPEQPIIAEEKWKAIQEFYLNNAPEQLDIPSFSTLTKPLPHFKVRISDLRLSPPSTTMVRIVSSGNIILGDANTQMLYQLNPQFNLIKAAKVNEGAVDITASPEHLYVTVMGSFSPTDNPSGFILSLPTTQTQAPTKLISGLQRPVHTAYADMNDDGLEDIITCEFGKWSGSLSWWENRGEGTFEKHLLRNKPGAINAYVIDWDEDGHQDILALFGQGDEGIFYYHNNGKGDFEEQTLLTFPPSYGSSYLGLFDWNNDGNMDLIYTCGDNADYPPVLKPYHGIYIFLNQGDKEFDKHIFYPLHGAYKAIPGDFDLDGDWDIAAISFFPDFEKQPEAGFVYLENKGNDEFTPYTFEENNLGRWLVMDAGDLDSDGDMDLILGSLTFEVVTPGTFVQDWVEQGIPFIYLENTTR